MKYFENYMKGACEKIADKTIQYDGRYCDVQSMAKKLKDFTMISQIQAVIMKDGTVLLRKQRRFTTLTTK